MRRGQAKRPVQRRLREVRPIPLGLEQKARTLAETFGLRLAAEGSPDKPRWAFFQDESDRFLMVYHVVSRLARARHTQARCRDWREAVETAARLAGRRLSEHQPSAALEPGVQASDVGPRDGG